MEKLIISKDLRNVFLSGVFVSSALGYFLLNYGGSEYFEFASRLTGVTLSFGLLLLVTKQG